MSTQKRFSRLAIAAGILLTASATCLAQTDSNVQTESIEPTVVAINKAPQFDIRTANSKSTTTTVGEATATEIRMTLSTARFMESAKDSFLKSNLTSTPEFRMELSNSPEFTEPVKTKRVEFVPSRGPRLPQ